MPCRPPDAIGNHVGLKSRKCQDVSSLSLLDENIRDRYRQQVPGWRVHSNSQGVQAIRQEWTARDKDSAQQLVNHIRSVGESEGHAVSHLDVVGESLVVAELSTPALGECVQAAFLFMMMCFMCALTGVLHAPWLYLLAALPLPFVQCCATLSAAGHDVVFFSILALGCQDMCPGDANVHLCVRLQVALLRMISSLLLKSMIWICQICCKSARQDSGLKNTVSGHA